MASCSVPADEVPDTQVSLLEPDNQLGEIDTQERDEISLTLPRSPLGEGAEMNGKSEAQDDVDQAGKGHDAESKEASQILVPKTAGTSQECEKAEDAVPAAQPTQMSQTEDAVPSGQAEVLATQAYINGSQGPEPVGVAEVKEHTPSGPEDARPGSQALVRADAFLEEMEEPDDAEALVESALRCKKCNGEVRLEDAIIRGPHELWCLECNALYTMLRRHQAWPPAAFVSLTDEAQQSFFAKCKKDKKDSNKGMFSYKIVRNNLLFTLTEEVTRQRKVSAGGTYLPLSVYEKKGYTIDPGFTWRNPSRWSDGLQDWTYLLAEVSINEEEIHASIEREILEAERSVRKRKGVDLEKASNENAAAVDDKKAKSTAAASEATMVMDLVTESESEGAHDEAQPKELSIKQVKQNLKREAAKASREQAAASRKEESERKKAANKLTKKVVQLSSKLSAPLAESLHRAEGVLQKAEEAGIDTGDFKAQMDVLQDMKRRTAGALQFYSKNPAAELAALPFESEKDVQKLMKELRKKGQELKSATTKANKGKK